MPRQGGRAGLVGARSAAIRQDVARRGHQPADAAGERTSLRAPGML